MTLSVVLMFIAASSLVKYWKTYGMVIASTAPLPSLELGGGGAGAGGQRAVLFDSIEVRIGERVTAIRLART